MYNAMQRVCWIVIFDQDMILVTSYRDISDQIMGPVCDHEQAISMELSLAESGDSPLSSLERHSD